MRLNVFHRNFVDGKDSVFGARLNCHVRDGKAIVYCQRSNAVAGKLHRFVQSAVNADFSDNVENQVFSRHIRLQFSVKAKEDG